MRTKYMILFACLLLFTQFSRCKKEPRLKEEQRFGPYYLNEARDYLAFQYGSYWIYQNDRTGEIDSTQVKGIELDTPTFFYESHQYKRWYTHERLGFDVWSSQDGDLKNYRTAEPCMNCPNPTVGVFCLNKDFSNALQVFYRPYNPNTSFFYTSLKVGSTTYDSVYRFDLKLDNSIPAWNTNIFYLNPNITSYYWAKNIGLIKLRVAGSNAQDKPDTMNWNVIKYKVRKF